MSPLLLPMAVTTFGLACLPGWILAARAGLSLGPFLAAGFAALFAVLTGTALLSELTGYLPAWATLVVASLGSVGTWLASRRQRMSLPTCPPILFLAPLLMVAHACLMYRVGFGVDQSPAVFRAWYNADWFKHLGHVHALINFGLPARDIFGGGATLHYYWLFYLLPAAGGSLYGDAGAMLFATNVTLIFFFWLLVTGFLKALGLSDGKAIAMTLFGWLVFTVDGALQMLRMEGDPWAYLTTSMMSSSLLSALNTFIPQHLLTVAGLLSFGLLWADRQARTGALRWLALAPVIAASATSTLLGATVVATGCLMILFIGEQNLARRFMLAVLVGTLAIGLVFVLQVVDLSLGHDSISSPAFEGATNEDTVIGGIGFGVLVQVVRLGLALPLGIWGLVHGLRRPGEERALVLFASLMLLVALGAMIASQGLIENLRLVGELRYRASYPTCLALLAGMSLLVRDLADFGTSRRSVLLLLALTALLAVPSNVFNLIWQGWGASPWQVVIPTEDMRAMRWLRTHSETKDMILQYPESIYLMGNGRDTWVPVFAGRMIPGSFRSTDWSEGEKAVKAAQRFYEEVSAPVPDGIDWIYLSRALHATTYDRLVARLKHDPAWQARYCEADVCLFARSVPARGRA